MLLLQVSTLECLASFADSIGFVQFCLESESNETRKDGHGKLFFKPLDSDEQIAETIAKSRKEENKSMNDLGMYDLLHN